MFYLVKYIKNNLFKYLYYFIYRDKICKICK